jgi:hypothetical protein
MMADRLLPDAIISQGAYGNATTAFISKVQGDPDVVGGTGFKACPRFGIVSAMSSIENLDIYECPVGLMGYVVCPAGETVRQM